MIVVVHHQEHRRDSLPMQTAVPEGNICKNQIVSDAEFSQLTDVWTVVVITYRMVLLFFGNNRYHPGIGEI